jgi:hypothetical protein
MRSVLTSGFATVLALGLLLSLCAPADAARVHRPKAPARHPVVVRPSQGPTSPARFSVPGWTDEQTQQWLDNATSCWACG